MLFNAVDLIIYLLLERVLSNYYSLLDMSLYILYVIR